MRDAASFRNCISAFNTIWPMPRMPLVEHRRALMRLSVQMPALDAAHKITGRKPYADKAASHLKAWFIDEGSRMNPNLQYAQAIHGRTTGRGTGVIDTIHLVEVAQAIPFVERAGALSAADSAAVKQWFREYTHWMTTSKNGIEERDTKNNHATCWGMQVAAFAKLTGDREQMEYVRNRYRTVYIPDQEAEDGSFPLELARTKPYGYSLFNLEAMAAICQILSDKREDLWQWQMPDGRGVAKAIAFLFPFIADKSKWMKPPDVMYYDRWPMRQSALLFGGIAL